MSKLRVWNNINFDKTNNYEVENLDQAVFLIETMANSQLQDKDITDNAFGLEEWNEEENEWQEWYDDERLDIDAYYLKDGKAVYIEAE